MKKFFTVATMLVVASLMISCGLSEPSSQSNNIKVDLVKGAQLYDNWPQVSGVKTEGSHPLYPATGKKQGGSSWRCKECHGWDYVGKDGRYAKGSHFTGITGTLQASQISPEKLYTVLTTGQHDFGQYMSEVDIQSLVKFVREGQVAFSKETGDITKGQKIFDANCSACHGEDGNDLDFDGKQEGIQGVGWLANDNPQESIHKYRWGHPNTDMPSMVVDAKLSEKQILDLLAYTQTLK